MKVKKKIHEIAENNGFQMVERLVYEECGELFQAISKYYRHVNNVEKGIDSPFCEECEKLFLNICKEIADVEIVVEELKYLIGASKMVKQIKEDVVKEIFRES